MRQLLKLLTYITVPLLVGFGTFQYLNVIFFKPLDESSTQPKMVEIAPELSLSALCKLLKEQNIIRQSQSLCLYRQLRGNQKPLVPGEYELSASMTPAQIIAKLENGDRYLRTVKIPDGANIEQIDQIFTESELLERHEFDAAARDPELLSRAGISAESFEGYLGSGEFSFSKPLKAQKAIWDMLEISERSWLPEYSEGLDKLRMSRHEMLTLASIVYKATDDPMERRKVATVLHNRLQNGMKLESYEALTYGVRDIDEKSDEDNRALPSPYNTFLNYGLPPGPILNPDKDSIEAVLFPLNSPNLLFYGKGKSGSLVFATTADELKIALEN